MGCDITPHVARRTGEGKLEPLMYSSLDLGRDYVMFGLMAGVRGKIEMFEPRGFPVDVPITYKFDFERMDAHTPSWLTTEEVRAVAEAYPSAAAEQGRGGGMNPFLVVLVGLMEALDSWATEYDPGGGAVLIFWFDS